LIACCCPVIEPYLKINGLQWEGQQVRLDDGGIVRRSHLALSASEHQCDSIESSQFRGTSSYGSILLPLVQQSGLLASRAKNRVDAPQYVQVDGAGPYSRLFLEEVKPGYLSLLRLLRSREGRRSGGSERAFRFMRGCPIASQIAVRPL
jgi:hypothetical protein